MQSNTTIERIYHLYAYECGPACYDTGHNCYCVVESEYANQFSLPFMDEFGEYIRKAWNRDVTVIMVITISANNQAILSPMILPLKKTDNYTGSQRITDFVDILAQHYMQNLVIAISLQEVQNI